MMYSKQTKKDKSPAERGLNDDTIRKFDIRYENGKLKFPVSDKEGNLVTIKTHHGPQKKGVKAQLYPRDALKHQKLVIGEGETDVWRLSQESIPCITCTCGASTTAKTWEERWAVEFEGKDVTIAYDNDKHGRSGAQKVSAALRGVTKSVKIVQWPNGLPDGYDLTDWLQDGHKFEELPIEELDLKGDHTLSSRKTKQESQADSLVRIAESLELFHDPKGECFARMELDDHLEIHRCKSNSFRRYLCGKFWEMRQKAPNSAALGSALNVIEAKAMFEGKEYSLANRVAWHEEAIWYDMSDKLWRTVRITPKGWAIVPDPPILFRRYAHQAPQVEPRRGGEISKLFDFVNIKGKAQQLVFVSYLVTTLVPSIPHPVVILFGPQGSAKSWTLSVVKALMDPSVVKSLSLPKGSVELVQMLAHHWTALFDNVSHLSEDESNALCRAVTGEGFAKRELYTDDEDVLYSFRRCIGLNGINIAATRADLLDRAILFALERIPSNQRKEECELDEEFNEARPFILGALFDILVDAMACLPKIKLPGLFRMADFTRWGAAVAQTLGGSAEDFLKAYGGNIATQHEEVVEASPVGSVLMAFMEHRDEWDGTPSALLQELEDAAETEKINTSVRAWPKAPNVLTRRLNELSTTLREVGIVVERDRTPGGHRSRKLTIRKASGNIVPTVPTEKHPSAPLGIGNDDLRDDRDDVFPSLSEQPQLDLPKKVEDWPDDDRETYEERAAIMEVEGGLSRAEAECQAEQQQRKKYRC